MALSNGGHRKKRKKTRQLKTSPVKTYEKQMKDCEKMFHDLGLEKSHTWCPDTVTQSTLQQYFHQRSLQSAPIPDGHRILPCQRKLLKTAWAGIDHLRLPRNVSFCHVPDRNSNPGHVTSRMVSAGDIYNRKSDASHVMNRKQSSSERKLSHSSYISDDLRDELDTRHLTPEGLCEILRTRGFGDPRTRKIWRPDERQILPEIFKRRRRALKIPYYMEKIRGQARLDCDIANNKAMSFCEERRKHVKDLKTASANYRFRLLMSTQSPVKSTSSKDKEEEGEGVLDDEDEVPRDEDLFIRIQSWIEEVDRAMTSEK